MKNARLDFEYEFDFNLLALISPEKEYKLALHLNKLLKVHFIKDEDIVLDFLKEGKMVVSNYSYKVQHSELKLLKNRCAETENLDAPFLISELKDYDYFMMIRSEDDYFDQDQILDKLKTLPLIQYCQKIDVNKLKSKDNLLF